MTDAACDHERELDADHLYPSDFRVTGASNDPDGDLRVELLVPCPACDQALEVETVADVVRETETDVPLGGDPEQPYD